MTNAGNPVVLVCGGREFNDYGYLRDALDNLFFSRGWHTEMDGDGNWLPVGRIIAGKARGADTLAIDWAVNNWIDFQEFPADWDKHGKAAGPIRNQQMLDEGKPDLVVAFPGGRGTADMVRRAKKAGVETLVFR